MIRGKRKAMIIGIDKYKDNNIDELHGAVNDATELFAYLSDRENGNFEISQDHYLIAENATCERIRKAISDIFWRPDPCDLTLFYFSGHGFVDSYRDGYIAPYDICRNEPFVCGLSMKELKEVTSKAKKSCVLMILDCCYSGIITKGSDASELQTMYDEHLKDLSGEGRIILASSESDKASTEINHTHASRPAHHYHGAFTSHLIDALDGSLHSSNGILTLNKIYEYIDNNLTLLGKQKPKFFASNVTGMDKIEIAISKKLHEEYITAKLEEARRNYETMDPGLLILAADNIYNISTYNENHQEALELKDQINNLLKEFQATVYDWWSQNKLAVRNRMNQARMFKVYTEIEEIVHSLNYDRVNKLDNRKKTLLTNLCDLCLRGRDMDDFVEECKPFSNPISQKLNAPLSHKV